MRNAFTTTATDRKKNNCNTRTVFDVERGAGWKVGCWVEEDMGWADLEAIMFF